MANKFAKLAENKVSARDDIRSENTHEDLFINLESKKSILDLNISEIKENPYQPRKFFDDEKQNELKESINSYGQLNPILVHKTESGEYFLVAGERRLKACQSLGHTTIKSILIDADPEIVALIDNIQREDLHPFERALAVYKLYEKYDKDKNKVAKAISTSVRTVERLLKLSGIKDIISCANGESAELKLTQNKIPLREFYSLLKYNDSDELNKRFNSLERKYSKEPDMSIFEKKKAKEDIEIAISLADKLLKMVPRLKKKKELEDLFRKILEVKKEIVLLIAENKD